MTNKMKNQVKEFEKMYYIMKPLENNWKQITYMKLFQKSKTIKR